LILPRVALATLARSCNAFMFATFTR